MRRLPLLLVPLLLFLALQAPSARAEPEPAGRLLGRMAVKEEGFVRIPAEALAELGALSADRVVVRRGGRAVPSWPADGKDLVFLAVEHRENHTAFGVYELVLFETSVPPGVPNPGPAEAAPQAPALPEARRTLATDAVHGSIEGGRPDVYGHDDAPTWFLAPIWPKRAAVLALDPAGAAPGTAQTIESRLWSTHEGRVSIQASWGSHDLGTASVGTAAGGALLRWRVPASAVPGETADLVLRDVSPPLPPAPPQDWSDGRGTLWVDSVSVAGPVRPLVDARLRQVPLMTGRVLVLRRGYAGEDTPPPILVAAVDGSGLPVAEGWRWHETPDRKAVVIDGRQLLADARVFVSTAARIVTPVAATEPPHPLTTAAAARHVIVAVPELVEAAGALARHRTKTGIPSAVVPVEDVYAAYGHGSPSYEALRAFLVDLMNREGAPLDYVLLAGDATLDRTDMTPFLTIPAPMARTMYNGATPADRLYALPTDGSQTGGPAIGRVPFRDAKTMASYVRRVIDYETNPPVEVTRRLMRFVTNESRFGPFIDMILERMFRTVVTERIPPAYDIEVTFASAKSPYLWPPPHFNDKVVEGFNDGCLFLTYVGHGQGRSFDRLRIGEDVFPVLDVDHVAEIDCAHTPPVLFVLACTTARFDHPRSPGIGESLLAHDRGPIAYWGATRVCHPAANTLLGRAIARFMSEREGEWRLGDLLARARDEVLEPSAGDGMRGIIDVAIRQLAAGADPQRLAHEGCWMYSLLGDPALQVAFPKRDVQVEAVVTDAREVQAVFRAPLPDGTTLHVTVEAPRDRRVHEPQEVTNPLDEASFEAIRENHRRVNDLVYLRAELVLAGGEARWTVALPKEIDGPRVVVKAWALTDDVHQGGVMLTVGE